MVATYRKPSNVVSWTNNLTAGSGTVSKGDLVHLGKGKFGVAVDDIAYGAAGELIVQGYFENGSAILPTSVIGDTLENTTANIMTVTTLQIPVVTSATMTFNNSNLQIMEGITASTAAQTFKFILR
jgi:hypothetical protein